MQIGIETSTPSRMRRDAAIVFARGTAGVAKAVRAFGADHAGAYRTLVKSKAFAGAAGQTRTFVQAQDTRVPVLVVVGVGDDPDGNTLRAAAGNAIRAARDAGAETVAVVLPAPDGKRKLPTPWIGAAAEGLCLGLYRFDQYKDGDSSPVVSSIDVLVGDGDASRARKAVKEGEILAAGVALARDLGNQPSNVATPSYLAHVAAEMADREPSLSLQVLDEDEMEQLGMGSLLGVTKGSAEPAKLVILTHTPKKSRGRTDTVAIVGKGITFDTGGISIKPAARLEDMKFDMCGGAAVFGAMQTVARLGLGVRVVGLIPAVENMPGGAAYKPGDILTAMNGTTIEVKNTDAEGRLVLADAITYAATRIKPKPKAVVDLATLTGACVVALGRENAAVIGNNDKLVGRLLDASERSGDGLWRLPLSDGYRKQLDSVYADVSNLGSPGAGTITAAAFLEKFTEGLPWSHLDIAGMAWTDKSAGTLSKGATGFGVRVLARFLKDW